MDFGPTRRVAPTKYTLKHGYTTWDYMLRNWVLEGSLDGQAPWTILRTHATDQSLPNAAYSTASWDMDAAYAGDPTPVRFLKVRMTGQNSHGDNELCLSGREVYGTLQISTTVELCDGGSSRSRIEPIFRKLVPYVLPKYHF